MAQTHHDLRKGKPGAEPTTNAKIAGHEDKIMPTRRTRKIRSIRG